jgi:hypothetical protein
MSISLSSQVRIVFIVFIRVLSDGSLMQSDSIYQFIADPVPAPSNGRWLEAFPHALT